tara:strand:- start:52 stop:255 length:204 start_codon:yes stop_codon:yes gene_type:complete
MTEVKLEKGMSLERALKTLKKKLDREGVLKEVKERRHFTPPSRIKYDKNRVAKYNARQQAKRDRLWR